ncbi:MAG: hypothetical protein ABI551_14075, partial [Polyangiaceae bacterium]
MFAWNRRCRGRTARRLLLGNAVMDVVMPKAGTLTDFESKLDGAQFQTILAGFSHGDVDVSLPKFG